MDSEVIKSFVFIWMAQQVSNIRALGQRVILSLEEHSLVLVDVDDQLPNGWRVDSIGRFLKDGMHCVFILIFVRICFIFIAISFNNSNYISKLELQLPNNVGGVNLHLWKIFYVALLPDFNNIFRNLTIRDLIQRGCCRTETHLSNSLAAVQEDMNGRLAQLTAQVTQQGEQLAQLTVQVNQQGNQLAAQGNQLAAQGNQMNKNINAILQHLGIAQSQ